MTSRSERAGRAGNGAPARRALVVGTGLIGGSLGLALRAAGWHVSGWDADPVRTREACALGVLDVAGDDVRAELAFVATPASAAATVARDLLASRDRPDGFTVSDVGGVKASLVSAVGHPRFVGGHPMAGSEQVGLQGADADLFAGAVWVLTPDSGTDLAAFSLVRDVVSSLGADVVVLEPDDHDRLVAVVSHVPHLVAATLMNAATQGAERDAVLLRLAAGGFRDMTRVAAGHPGIWPDVCVDNSTAIVGSLDRVIEDLSEMRDRVAKADREALLDVLGRASAARRHLPRRGARPARLSEVRVPVSDREGVLAGITRIASDLGINIYDIEIAHSAEGPRGICVLLVDFSDADRLRETLDSAGYHATAQVVA